MDMTQAIASPRSLRLVASLLFVPGDDGLRIAKAACSSADAVVIDLEDGVTAAASKALARHKLPDAVASVQAQGKVAVVRINHDLLHLEADLRACVHARADAFMWPKAASPDLLRLIDHALHQLGADKDMACIALVEDPATIASAATLRTLLGAPRVQALVLGSEDFSAAMQAPPTTDLLAPAVYALTLAARTRPLARVYAMPHSIADISGGPAWADAAYQARALGANGALCVHPRQLDAVNRTFAVTAEELGWARQVMQAVAAQPERPVFVVQGQMVDAPVLARARHILARAGHPASVPPCP
jgi:citrate lyase subunit beta / citryl-CoA lyase